MSQRAKYHQENIEIQDSKSSLRLKVIRQDRKDVEDLNCFIEINGQKQKVFNISSFGLMAVAPIHSIPIEIECPLVVENIELGILRLKQIRVQKSSDDITQLLGFEILGEPFDLARIYAVEKAQKIVADNSNYQLATKKIPDLFARKVYEVKDWLEELQRQIDAIQFNEDHYQTQNQHEFELAFVQIMGDYFNNVMPIKNKDLGELIRDYNSKIIKDCYEFFREKLKMLIYQAPFSGRVFHKPLGYAGDYEMMNIIYRSMPEGETLFAKCLHNYWIKQPAAQAVRNRADYMQNKIIQTIKVKAMSDLRFLSVACGPAKEWQNLLANNISSDQNLTVDLLDQDELALKYAQRQIKEQLHKTNSTVQFNYIHKAIKNILVKGLENKYDLIYSAGLFDYFSDPVAQIAAGKLYEALNPGGQLVIGNFNVENPNSIVMDLALDWHLIYRSIEDLKRMFSHLGDDLTIEAESLSINLFCIISKKTCI